jgi:type II secretory pathway pseudopilin PulG
MFRTWISKARSQEGFTLAGLIVILTIMAMLIAYTVPDQWSMILQRERDRQTIHLMKQFARSIDAFQKKNNNALPTSLDQIYDARRPRLIRGVAKWPCPLTGSEKDWILVPEQAIVNRQGGGGPGQPGTQGGWSQLNPDLSPPEYANAAFVGVRPKKKGESFIEFNGASDYNLWVYTVYDLALERQMREAALTVK